MQLFVNGMFARKFTAITIALVLVVSATVPASAKSETEKTQPTGGRISGRVFGADGKAPVAGAVVTAVPLQGETATSAAPSNAKGEFLLEGLTFGYFDLVVEASGATFVANRVVNVPPSGKLVVEFSLTPFADKSPSWWAGREQRSLPGGAVASGSAEMRQGTRGAAFWKSPGGIAVIAGIGGLALLAIASGGGSSDSVSPSTAGE